MSYKTCFFGIPTHEMSIEGIWQLFQPMASELRMENGWNDIFLVTNTDKEAKASGLRLIDICVRPATSGVISRDFFIERWPPDGPPYYVLVYDDQNGVFLFQHFPKEGRAQSILTDGHHVGVCNLELTVDYPQKPFTNAELDEAFKLPEEKLNDAQRNALMEWDDALTIGFRQFGFKLSRSQCLNLIYAKEAWPLIVSKPEKRKFDGMDSSGVIDFYVESWTFKSHGLVERYY